MTMYNEEILHYEKTCEPECCDGDIRTGCETLSTNTITNFI